MLWTVPDFVHSFGKLLNYMDLDKVHLMGVSLGGYLAQKFAEATSAAPRVQSLLLCNTFCDTAAFTTMPNHHLYLAYERSDGDACFCVRV